MPNKGHRGGERPTGAGASWREQGVPNAGSSLDNFAGFIRFLQSTFNADYKITDGTLYIERRDQFKKQVPWVIPNTFTDQENLQDLVGFNTDEIKANYLITYRFDSQDQNTLDNQEGRVFQAQLSPQRTNNAKLTLSLIHI